MRGHTRYYTRRRAEQVDNWQEDNLFDNIPVEEMGDREEEGPPRNERRNEENNEDREIRETFRELRTG